MHRRAFDGINHNVVEIPMGMRYSKTYCLGNDRINWIRPEIDLMYVRSVADDTPTTMVRFLDNAMLPWEIRGTHLSRDAFRMSAGLTGCTRKHLEMTLSYDLDSRKDYPAS